MKRNIVTAALLALCAAALALAASFAGCGGDDAATDAGGAATCDNSKYQSSCLTALGTGCFTATGTCTWKDKTEIDWANGAKITNVIVGTDVTSTFWSKDGQKCYTAQASFTSGQTAYDYSLTTNDGKTFKFHSTVVNSQVTDTTVTCPDGKTEEYTAADFAAIKACFQSASAGDQTQSCKCADGTYGCITSSASYCTIDTDCIGKPEGEKCCGATGSKTCAKSCAS